MTHLNEALVLVGGAVLSFGLVSRYVRKHALSEVLAALLLGVLIGPSVLDVLNLHRWGSQSFIVEEVARLTLAVGLMSSALRLPRTVLSRHWRSLSLLLTLVMIMMWVISSLLIYLVLRPPLLVAFLAGAIVTPTDPVVSGTIVSGELAERSVPASVRHIVSGESGANDGLAFPFVMLPILLLEHSTGPALAAWGTTVLLREIAGGMAFAIVLGYGAGWLLRWSRRRQTIGQESFIAYPSALALVALGGAWLVGSDGVLAVFVAGVAFTLALGRGGWDRSAITFGHRLLDRLFLLPVFMVLGTVLPWHAWARLGWRAPVLVLAVLILRRLPVVVLVRRFLPPLHGLVDAAFVGWFGPIGVGALFYVAFALRMTGLQQVWTIATLLIAGSVVVHAVTATPLTRWYGAYRHRTEQTPARGRDVTA